MFIRRVIGATALPLVLALAHPAAAQDALSTPPAAPAGTPVVAPVPVADQEAVSFSADAVEYDTHSEVVTATGQVRLNRDGNYVAADQVSWNRNSGQVVATGNVVVVNPEGDKLVGERVVLTDELRDGTIENLLVVLESGGRIAAEKATRTDGVTTLDNAVYSPCPVTCADGQPKKPSWRILAARVVYDANRDRIRFDRGRLEILGITLPLLPIFSVPTGSGTGGGTGVLFPDVSISRRNGLELALPWHWRIAPNRDLTLTPHIYTGVRPALEARYRELNSLGAFHLGGFVTYGERTTFEGSSTNLVSVDQGSGIRAFVEGYGKFQFDPLWSLTTQIRRATDKTVARRYDITRDDKLRSFFNVERIDLDSYISFAGWSFQGLRAADDQQQIPIALPAFDARWRLDTPGIGGRVELHANSLAILRRDGQDTQRAFVGARWDRRLLTRMGQELLLTGFARADAYHTDETGKTDTVLYRGTEGWNFRGIGAVAAEARWPLIGALLGGTQRLTPRVQLVVTPKTENLDIPNEDARAVDLEDSNLFALNRFPGYDRWEDGSRVTYGLDWNLDRPGVAVATTIGQSYRLNRREQIFPDGTGLTDRWSDIVGRTRVQFGRFLDLTHRYRIDKDSFAIRRNELDLTVGTTETYARIGYLRLNRDIDTSFEDLRDKEELRLAGRWKFHPNWAVFGATVLDLTDEEEDPLSLADGLDAVRHRLGLDYEDDCLAIGILWRQDYERIGDDREGSRVQFRLTLKGLGR
ncbi:LPS-assembly protein LptD [Sphingomonas arenae]|uniref:LPS-assembly protein LptD n=1 Tax=Sphingomonas arenae TaxID=2812555 RepID=UPI0030133B29